MKLSIMVLAGFLGVLVFQQGVAEDQPLNVTDPWIRAAPPVVKVLAAYMTIENHSNRRRSVVGAESPIFDRTEIHNTVVEEGLARMLRQDRIDLPPHSSITFSPGGYHFMLLGRKQPIEVGDRVEITLILDDGDRLTLKALVRSGMEMPEEEMDHSGHGMHH